MNRNFEHDNRELVKWGEEVVNTVCAKKVGYPTEVHTHYLLPSRNTAPCVTHCCCI